MKDFVERLRAKSEDTRKKIALGTAAGVTALVAIGWIIALVSSGGLAVAPRTPSADTEASLHESQQRFNQVAGAASAFYESNGEAGMITIVEEENSSTLDRTDTAPTDETVIHF